VPYFFYKIQNFLGRNGKIPRNRNRLISNKDSKFSPCKYKEGTKQWHRILYVHFVIIVWLKKFPLINLYVHHSSNNCPPSNVILTHSNPIYFITTGWFVLEKKVTELQVIPKMEWILMYLNNNLIQVIIFCKNTEIQHTTWPSTDFLIIDSSACSITVSNTTCYCNLALLLLVFIYICSLE
jgi:hypothetical protein